MDLGGSSSTEVSQQSNPVSTSEMEENSTTLLNLPPICLDHVLKHLNLTDLTNAANSHSALTASAIRVFGVYFKHKPILLCRSPWKFQLIQDHWRKELRPTIQLVSKRNLISSILNHFGPKMKSLCIVIEHRFILDKVVEKCGPNLTTLHVLLGQKDLHLNHRFPKLHELVFTVKECNIHNSFSKLNEHFPELRCLEIHNWMGLDFKFEETFVDHISNLTRFTFTSRTLDSPHNWRSWNGNASQLRRIGEFVNANKHMKSLRLDTHSNDIVELQASINWEELEIIDLHVSANGVLNVRHIGQLRQLRTLRVTDLPKHSEFLDLNQLEELDISFASHSSVNPFRSCNNLKKLTVRHDVRTINHLISSTSSERVTDIMPQLKEVTFKIPHLMHIKTNLPILIGGISALMRQRRSLHSIEVIVPRGMVDWSLIQNENWELELSSVTIETARLKNKMIRNS